MSTFKEILEKAKDGITAALSPEIASTLSPVQKLEINAWLAIHGNPSIDSALTTPPTQEPECLQPPVNPYQECHQWLIAKSSSKLMDSTFVEFQQKTPNEKAMIACIAAQLGQHEFIAQLLDKKLVSLRTHYPQAPWATMLYFAAASKNKNLVLALMKKLNIKNTYEFVCVQLTSPKGHTPFHMAAGTDDLELLQEMITQYQTFSPGSSLLKFNVMNITMKQLAKERKASLVLAWITQEIEEAKKKAPRLQFAARIGDIGMLQESLANPKNPSDVGAGALNDALHLAAQNGHIAVIEALIKSGADVNSKKDNDCTALILAAQNGHAKAVQPLIDKGANIDLQNEDGWTALMFAAQQRHVDIAQALIDKGANIDLQNEDGWTALMSAAQQGHVDIAQALINKGAKIDLQSKDGWTALMSAAHQGHVDAAQALIDKGANIDLQSKDGWTALMLATLLESPKSEAIVKALSLAAQRPIDANPANGTTPPAASIGGSSARHPAFPASSTEQLVFYFPDGATYALLTLSSGHSTSNPSQGREAPKPN